MRVDEYLQALESEGLRLFDKISDYQPENHLEGLIATLKINSKIREKYIKIIGVNILFLKKEIFSCLLLEQLADA